MYVFCQYLYAIIDHLVDTISTHRADGFIDVLETLGRSHG